jgi:hypothetical protein
MKKTIGIVIILLLGLNISLVSNGLADAVLQVSLTENPIIVSPGSNGFIEITLENIGSDTVKYIDIETSILDSSVIKYQGNWDVHIGSLNSKESTNIIYEFSVASSASPGLYQVVFETDSSASETKVTAFIRVEDSSVLDIVSVSPSLINIGEVSTLLFNISNNGGECSGTILFTWNDEENLILPVGADNRISVDSIPAGNYSLIPVELMASPAIIPGVYPLSITLTYFDDSGSQQVVTSDCGIQVSGGTDFEIILQQSSTSGTTFAVANTGANTASSVIFSIPLQTGYSATGASSVSLGNLDAGDYTLATFQLITMNQNTSDRLAFNRDSSKIPTDFNPSTFDQMRNRTFQGVGENNLIVEISYTDLFGLRQTVQKEVAVTSLSSSGTNDIAYRMAMRDMSGFTGEQDLGLSSGTLYIIIGVVGIILIIVILQLGKTKKIPYISKIIKGRKNENN